MGRLSTHVLDTSRGRPAEGVSIRLYRLGAKEDRVLLKTAITNKDGRTDTPLLQGDAFDCGTYELLFDVGAYFGANDGADSEAGTAARDPFLRLIPLRFTMGEDAVYHVPLLVTPWSYSTYRGS